MRIKLLETQVHPAHWVPNRPRYQAGTELNAIPVTNLAYEGAVWLDTPELKDCPYGMLVHRHAYEIIEP